MTSSTPEPKDAAGFSPARQSLYADAGDRSRHLHNMERLAQETGMPIDELAPLYEDLLAGFSSRARIQDYLPILISKSVKDLLRRH